MQTNTFGKTASLIISFLVFEIIPVTGSATPSNFSFHSGKTPVWISLVVTLMLLFIAIILKQKIAGVRNIYKKKKPEQQVSQLRKYTLGLNSSQIGKLIQY